MIVGYDFLKMLFDTLSFHLFTQVNCREYCCVLPLLTSVDLDLQFVLWPLLFHLSFTC